MAAEYPIVQRLLEGLDESELSRAGRLLARVPESEIVRHHPSTAIVKVSITGHATLAALLPGLTAEFARHGLLIHPQVDDFDSYVASLLDAGSELYASDPDLALCLLDHHIVLDELSVPWTVEDVAAVLAAKTELVEKLAGAFASQARGTLVLNTIPLLRTTVTQLVDHRSRARLGVAWREANARLLRLMEAHSSVVVMDLDPMLAEGVEATDPRLSVYAKAHLSHGLLTRYARDVAHLARHLTGRTRKCLVLDLDETVWGGVLGEAGPEGIEVGEGARGGAFTAFQRVLKQLASQGILLAAISKNDLEPVRQVLTDHPLMTLRESDFARVTADWRPKHQRLAEIAAALGLGTDSLVFVDDSSYERGLIRRELPEVAVIDLDGEPASYIGALLADGWFDTRETTAEDRRRTELYREERDREDFLDSFASLEEFLRELRTTVTMRPIGRADVKRVSQLTLRTNQFNMTTPRLQPAEVAALLEEPDTTVLGIRAADRFGDHGMVGAIFTRRVREGLRIDNFLLSCRVFSRGIEQACLRSLLRHARDDGLTSVLGAYRATAKNGHVRSFYARNGFQPVGHGESEDLDPELTWHRHDLRHIEDMAAYVQLKALPRSDCREEDREQDRGGAHP